MTWMIWGTVPTFLGNLHVLDHIFDDRTVLNKIATWTVPHRSVPTKYTPILSCCWWYPYSCWSISTKISGPLWKDQHSDTLNFRNGSYGKIYEHHWAFIFLFFLISLNLLMVLKSMLYIFGSSTATLAVVGFQKNPKRCGCIALNSLLVAIRLDFRSVPSKWLQKSLTWMDFTSSPDSPQILQSLSHHPRHDIGCHKHGLDLGDFRCVAETSVDHGSPNLQPA